MPVALLQNSKDFIGYSSVHSTHTQGGCAGARPHLCRIVWFLLAILLSTHTQWVPVRTCAESYGFSWLFCIPLHAHSGRLRGCPSASVQDSMVFIGYFAFHAQSGRLRGLCFLALAFFGV